MGDGGGLGLRITAVEDGNDGARWQSYVRGEADFGGAIELAG